MCKPDAVGPLYTHTVSRYLQPYSVMFMPDQLRYDSLGCTGDPVIHTPHFDALAKEGTLFTSETEPYATLLFTDST
jgi:hypothetical protein